MGETKKLSEIAEILNGYAFESKKYVDAGLRIIRIANVQDGVIVDNSPCFYPYNTDVNIEKYRSILRSYTLIQFLYVAWKSKYKLLRKLNSVYPSATASKKQWTPPCNRPRPCGRVF